LLRKENSWIVILLTLHSFHVSDHFSIDFIQPLLFLTWLFITNRTVEVLFPISIFVYFPRNLFSDLLIRAFNRLLLTNCCFLIRDWNFVSRILLSVFLCFNPCRTIQINCFQLIFYPPTAFGRIRLILLPILFRHVWVNRSKPIKVVLLQFQWVFYPHHVSLQFRNSWDVIAFTITFHSFPIPSFLVLVWPFEWKIICFISKTHAFSNLATDILQFDYC
jgi:hypothetical protein